MRFCPEIQQMPPVSAQEEAQAPEEIRIHAAANGMSDMSYVEEIEAIIGRVQEGMEATGGALL